MKIIKVLLLLTCFSPLTAWSSIVVSVNPSSSYLTVGETFTVDINAFIPDPVIGWGLELFFDDDMLTQVGSIVGPDWSSTIGLYPGHLGGLAFPDAVMGSNVLLATLTFEAFNTGTSDILTNHNPYNLAQGFPLLSPPGTFRDAAHFPATITVPSSPPLLLIALPLLLIAAFHRQLISK